jgi:PAS domain S-box-containing protein
MKFAEKLLARPLLLTLSGVLPLAVFAVVLLIVFTEQQKKAMTRLLHETASGSARIVERTLGEQLGILKGLAASHALDDNDYDAFRRDAERLWTMHPEWRTVILTDVRQPIFNLRFAPGEQIPQLRDPVSLQRVLTTQEPVVGDFIHGHVTIRVPVIRNEVVKNTLVVTIKPQFFLDALNASTQLGQWGYILADSKQLVIAASPEAPVTVAESLPHPFPAQMEEGNLNDNIVYGAPVHFASSDWRIFLFAPAAVIEAPYAKKRLIIYLGGILAAALTAVLLLALGSVWATRQETAALRREIDKRKVIQEALADSEQRFRLLVENAPDAIFVEIDGRFAYLNRTAGILFGAGHVQDLLGKPVIERFHPDFHDLMRESLRLLNEERQVVPRKELICLRIDDTPVTVDISGVPIEYDGKNGALAFVRDMTETNQARRREKELEQRLDQAQRMESVGRLAGGVAHDYNNMLGVIVGYSELALENSELTAEMREYLGEIHQAANRSADITRQLLAFARKQTIAPVVLDLNDAVESMLKMLRRLIGEDVDLAWLPGSGLWPVKMDPSQIDQLLVNLCVNGRDAIDGVGKITIRTDHVVLDERYCADHPESVPGEYVQLAVSDDGRGMEREIKDKIFEPFFTTKEMGRGTGLGLATVYGIVSQNNGIIAVDSEPGQGTTFNIYIPRHAEVTAESPQPGSALVPLGQGELILVVEDEAAIMKLAKRILEGLGYQVITAAIPSQAILLARKSQKHIDLLITDVIMPETNGKELSTQLTAEFPKLKTLFMSGYTADVIAHRAVLEDGMHFIRKPFSLEAMARTVRETLDS